MKNRKSMLLFLTVLITALLLSAAAFGEEPALPGPDDSTLVPALPDTDDGDPTPALPDLDDGDPTPALPDLDDGEPTPALPDTDDGGPTPALPDTDDGEPKPGPVLPDAPADNLDVFDSSNYVNLGHTTFAYMDNEGKTILSSSEGKTPRGLDAGLNVNIYDPVNNSLANGKITLPDLPENLTLKYYYVEEEAKGEITYSGTHVGNTFYIADEFAPYGSGSTVEEVDGKKLEVFFPNETTFSGQRFVYSNDESDTINMSGPFPKVRTTAEQLKCAPYVELTKNAEGKVDGFELRFVDASNPSVTLKKSAVNDVWRVDKYEIAFIGEEDRYEHDDYATKFTKYFDEGEELKMSYKFPSEGIRWSYDGEVIRPIEDIHFFQLRFKYDSGISPENNAHVFYEWNYYVNPAGDEQPAILGSILEADETKAKDSLQKELSISSEKVENLKSDSVTTNSSALSEDVDLQNRASAAVSVSADLAEKGNALLLASSISLPVNAASLGGETLPTPDSIDTFKESYEVIIRPDEGDAVDLVTEFPDVVTFDNAEAKIDFPVVIVDGDVVDSNAPGAARGAAKAFGNVVLTEAGILTIYDGNEDGRAVAQIASALKREKTPPNNNDNDDKTDSGSGGGCSTGAFGLAAAGVICAMIRRRGA
ncbi:MAG: hypothetical protein LBO21_08090 [Synergistaceae bacterium]|nr:hypothetical protein [Synergistaceae bacterium]